MYTHYASLHVKPAAEKLRPPGRERTHGSCPIGFISNWVPF